MDSRVPAEQMDDLEARHLFHRRHQRSFRIGICLTSVAVTLLLPSLNTQALRLYLILGTPLFAYFVLIHAGPFLSQDGNRRLPKEIAVGVFFSAAVFIPTVARDSSLQRALLPAALLFAAVCSLNCLFIYTWEHQGEAYRAHVVTRFALRHLPLLAIFVGVLGGGLPFASRQLPWPIPVACTLSTALLLVLHRRRHRLTATSLRAAADVCLLTPILLLAMV